MESSDLVRFGGGVVWLQKTRGQRHPLGLASSDLDEWCGLLAGVQILGRSDIA